MVRTVIALEEDEKAWLDRRAAELGVPMTELVRRAVHLLRRTEQAAPPTPYEVKLDQLAGTWTEGDGLEWQRRMRREWEPDAE